MARTSLGVHPALRRRLQLFCAAPIAFFLIALVVIVVFRDNLFGSGKPGIVFGLVSLVPVGIGLHFARSDLRLWRRLRSFDDDSELTWIEVLEDTSRDERGIARRVLEFGNTADGSPSRQMRWTLDERRHGSPVYLGDDPPRVWALRANDGSGLITAFSTSGYPFAWSARELRALGDEPEPTNRRKTSRTARASTKKSSGARPSATVPRIMPVSHGQPPGRKVTWRPDLPAQFEVFPKMRALQKSAIVVLLILSGIFGVMAWKVGVNDNFFWFPIGLLVFLFGGAIYWARVEGSTIGPLTLDEYGLTIRSLIRTHDVDWQDIDRVTIHGWNEKARRRRNTRLVAGAVAGGVVGVGGAPAGIIASAMDTSSRARDRRDVDDLEPVDQALVLAGAHEPDVVPELAFFDDRGQRLLRLRGTHTWRAAHAILSEAWARGKELG